MTLNEKYRLESLTYESQMEYQISQWTEEVPKFAKSITEKIHSIYTDPDDIEQKLARVKVLFYNIIEIAMAHSRWLTKVAIEVSKNEFRCWKQNSVKIWLR